MVEASLAAAIHEWFTIHRPRLAQIAVRVTGCTRREFTPCS
jgi:hypothetical protein